MNYTKELTNGSDIDMTIAEKQQLIHHLYDSCERCIMSPENPLTLDNPDAIIANGNKLYAIYIPTYRENEDTDHLLRRLYLSQLSYGYRLIPILLTIEEGALRMLNNQTIIYAFAHLTNSVEDTLSYVNQANPHYKKARYFSELQSSQYALYRKYLQLSEDVHREVHSAFSVPDGIRYDKVITRSWSTNKPKESKYLSSVPGGFVASVTKKKNESFKTAFEQLMTIIFMSKFRFDNGEIYPTAIYDELSVMNTDWVMYNEESMPNSYNHMLSYIGLPPVAVSTEREMAQVFEMYQIIRNHGIG